MTNILEAIVNIAEHSNYDVNSTNSGRNRMNNMGEALEKYVIDAFAGTLTEEDEIKRMKIQNSKFSWLGNQNNPPDALIKNGDAIEVKKTQTATAALALNSSYPKATIISSSTQIAKGCIECETWTERDIIYAVGYTNDTSLNSLWLVYGTVFAAKHEVYDRIKNTIKTGIKTIPDVEFADTQELGGVKKVDPLGITNLRIRGMWHIHNPRKVFDYLKLKEGDYKVVAIIPIEKYKSFPRESISRVESPKIKELSILDIQVKNPNNTANLIDCKLITIKTEND